VTEARGLCVKDACEEVRMPYPFQNCFVCPVCGEPICVALGELNEYYACDGCGAIVHVHLHVEKDQPSPVDKRHLC